MGAVRSLNLGIKVNGQEVENTFKAVTKKMYDLRREVNRTEEGTEDWIKANKELAVVEKQRQGMIDRQKEFRKEITNTTEETGKNQAAIQDFGQSFGQVTSGIINGDLIQVQEGLKGMKTGIMGATKASLAFIATPLGATLAAIALAVGAVTQYFRDSEEGQNAWNKVTAVTSTVVGNFTDLLSDLGAMLIKVFSDPLQSIKDFGNFLVDNIVNRFEGMLELIPGLAKSVGLLLKGEFTEAGKVAGDAILKVSLGVEDATDKIANGFTKAGTAAKNFGKEVADEMKRAAELADLEAEADKIERGLIVERGKVEAQVAEARLKARDEEKYSAAERKAFLEEAVRLQNGLLDKEIEAASIRAQIKTQQNEFSKSTKEDLDEEARLIAQVDSLRRKKAEAERTMVRDQLRVDNELKAAQAKNNGEREEREAKTLEALATLRSEYAKKQEDLIADTVVKQAELDMHRALQKAEALGAEQALLDQIRETHQVKIKEAQEKEEEEKLKRFREFEAKKRALEDELELIAAESQAERDEIKKQQEIEKAELEAEERLAKFEEDIAFLELSEEEKAKIVENLQEAHQQTLLGIQTKYTDKKIQDEKRLAEQKKKLWNDSLNAAISAAGAETKVGQALLFTKELLAAKEMAVELGLFQSKMALNTAEATGSIAAGSARTASVGFPQNIPLLIAFAAQVSGIIGTIKNAAKSAAGIKKSFAVGGDTTPFGMGYRDASGEEVAGIVHTGEYVIPKFVRQEPEVPRIIEYLEEKRLRKLRGYNTGGPVSDPDQSTSTPEPSSNSTDLLTAVDRLIERLDAGLEAHVFFGVEAEVKRQELQNELNKLQQRAKIKKD